MKYILSLSFLILTLIISSPSFSESISCRWSAESTISGTLIVADIIKSKNGNGLTLMLIFSQNTIKEEGASIWQNMKTNVIEIPLSKESVGIFVKPGQWTSLAKVTIQGCVGNHDPGYFKVSAVDIYLSNQQSVDIWYEEWRTAERKLYREKTFDVLPNYK